MSEFGTEERRLLGALRTDEAPTRDDRDRVRARIASRVGIAATVAAAGGATATVVKTAGATSGTWGGLTAATWLKMGALVAVTSFGIGAALRWSETPGTLPVEPPEANASAHSLPVSEIPKEPSAQPIVEHPPAEEPSSPNSAVPEKAVPGKRQHAVAQTGQKSDLQGELKLLGAAQNALKVGDASAALKALDELARKHPGGALSVERAGLRAVALCASGQENAGESAAKRFLKKNPGSPLAGRVRAACFSSAN